MMLLATFSQIALPICILVVMVLIGVYVLG